MSISGRIIKSGNVIIEVDTSATLQVNGELVLNNNLPVGSNQECIIRLYKNSEMIVMDTFYINYGTTIQVFEGGKLTLHSGSFNSNTIVGVGMHMQIGRNFLGGRNVVLYDSDFHDIWIHDIKRQKEAAVRIGNDVWIGANAMVLKGVTIGDGAIVGAGSVVTHDIFPNCMVAGNPATVLKHDVRWKF